MSQNEGAKAFVTFTTNGLGGRLGKTFFPNRTAEGVERIQTVEKAFSDRFNDPGGLQIDEYFLYFTKGFN